MVLFKYGLSEKSKDVSFFLLGVDLIIHVPTLYRSRTSVVSFFQIKARALVVSSSP